MTTMTPNRIPPYKITKPSPPHKAPKPTPRTHEENQERAYIAASRRSDRSLEARMESAKRASEIHKKRTGRYFRITEETVINEQMYEEEDDTPRFRLTGHMQLPNTLLQQRAQAMMSIQMENRKILGQAVNSTLQHNPQFQNQAQFINPGFMQMSPSGSHFPMLSPQAFNHSPQTPTGYPQSPYPTPSESTGQGFHQRSASIAEFQRQYSQSAQTSPVETNHDDSRRMSLPPQNTSHRSPQFSIHRTSSSHNTPSIPQNVSYPNTPSFQQHVSTPLQQPQHLDHSNYGGLMGPLTTDLPRDTQQLLDSGLWPNMSSGNFGGILGGMMQSPKQQQPFYSYRPNSSGKTNSKQPTSVGLDQTLLATSSESKLGGRTNEASDDKPTSTNNVNWSSNTSDHGYDFAFDNTNMFDLDNFGPLNTFNSSQNSTRATPPATDEWTSFLDNDMFNEIQPAA